MNGKDLFHFSQSSRRGYPSQKSQPGVKCLLTQAGPPSAALGVRFATTKCTNCSPGSSWTSKAPSFTLGASVTILPTYYNCPVLLQGGPLSFKSLQPHLSLAAEEHHPFHPSQTCLPCLLKATQHGTNQSRTNTPAFGTASR